MPIKTVYTYGKVPVKVWTDEIESDAITQLVNCANMGFIHKHIAVMPDVHVGKGAAVGSVIPTYKAIIPAAVGVDLGCGMSAVRTNLIANDMPDSLAPIRASIENVIPLGRGAMHDYRLKVDIKSTQPQWNEFHKKFCKAT